MINNKQVCCFIGHRSIEVSQHQVSKFYCVIEDLILSKNVGVFLFGSCSQFNTLCHLIITDLKIKYPFIKRVFYTCRSEYSVLEKDRQFLEKSYSKISKNKVELLGFDEEYEHKNKYVSGKASYVERNRAMIDDCDICIIYYKEKYQPPKRMHSNKNFGYYQPKSGTRLAYEYIKQRKKGFINFADLL